MGGPRREARSAAALRGGEKLPVSSLASVSLIGTLVACARILCAATADGRALPSARGDRRATPHPASARLTAFAKPAQPSPARGEGNLFGVRSTPASRVLSRAILLALLGALALAPAGCGRKGAPVLPPPKTDGFQHDYPKSTDPQTGVFSS